jgi:hypothetical protein
MALSQGKKLSIRLLDACLNMANNTLQSWGESQRHPEESIPQKHASATSCSSAQIQLVRRKDNLKPILEHETNDQRCVLRVHFRITLI